MSTVTISKNYEVALPEEIRESLNLSPGEELQVVLYAGRVELIPIRSIESMQGYLKGMNTDFEREEDRL